MKESVTIQYRFEDAVTGRVETITIASIGFDQWGRGHPDLFNLGEHGYRARSMRNAFETACEAVLHEMQDIKWED